MGKTENEYFNLQIRRVPTRIFTSKEMVYLSFIRDCYIFKAVYVSHSIITQSSFHFTSFANEKINLPLVRMVINRRPNPEINRGKSGE